jgi:hypothetical protein
MLTLELLEDEDFYFDQTDHGERGFISSGVLQRLWHIVEKCEINNIFVDFAFIYFCYDWCCEMFNSLI